MIGANIWDASYNIQKEYLLLKIGHIATQDTWLKSSGNLEVSVSPNSAFHPTLLRCPLHSVPVPGVESLGLFPAELLQAPGNPAGTQLGPGTPASRKLMPASKRLR